MMEWKQKGALFCLVRNININKSLTEADHPHCVKHFIAGPVCSLHCSLKTEAATQPALILSEQQHF